ncbi:phosphoribosylglycinamide formyltransferase [Candidatus Micrarchaeota archaeon]|nr:phosphoribosylglycinamide formyltransferase [Candidatus Micrarchaeota archaeon]
MKKISLIVLSSGRGSNFQALIDWVKNESPPVEIKALITDNPNAQSIQRAKEADIDAEVVSYKEFEKKEKFHQEIFERIEKYEPDLIILAGYMRILRGEELFKRYQNRILNIHPSLLPQFKGSTNAQKDAFEAGLKVSGLTIHYVTENVDGGKIIYQEKVDISGCKDELEVAETILKREHLAYKGVIGRLAHEILKTK